MKIDSSTTALVTGANGGLGRAIARELHRAGARVVLSGRRADALEPLAAELSARIVVADLARPEDVDRLVLEAGEIDILVLNAGLPGGGSIFEQDVEQIEETVRVNLTAPILTARAIGAGMMQRGRGQIVFISSVAGRLATAGASIYSATKFGLRGFSLALRGDLAPHGIGVTGIYPGFIRDAGMFAESGAVLPPGIGTRSPEDVARAVLDAVRDNPPEIVVAAVDQRIGAFFGDLFPRLVDFTTRHVPHARKLAADTAEGQRRRRADRAAGK